MNTPTPGVSVAPSCPSACGGADAGATTNEGALLIALVMVVLLLGLATRRRPQR